MTPGDPPALPGDVKAVHPLPGLTGEEWVRVTDYDVIHRSLLAALWERVREQIEQQFAELFGTPPDWSISVPPQPPALCASRPGEPDPEVVSVRMRPGAYHDALPTDARTLAFLAGWSERHHRLHFERVEPVTLPERFR